MRKVLVQALLVLVLAGILGSAYLLARDILELPFRPTNDALHAKDAWLNLDFLIPGGVHLDERITIREVLEIRVKQKRSFTKEILKPVAELIPPKYRYAASALLYVFWGLCFMGFLRVFTFAGYGRAVRISLLLAGITYYFMPDFVAGRADDIGLIALGVVVIALRKALRMRKKRSSRFSDQAKAPAAL